MASLHTVALGLLGLGAFVSFLNWVYLFLCWRSGRFVSPIPLIGGVCLGIGAILLPDLRPYAWVAPLLDCYGTGSLLLAVPAMAREAWTTCRLNLLEEYVGRRNATTVRLRLFRRGLFTLQWDVKRPPGEYGILGMGKVGTWEREADLLVLRDGANRATFEPLTDGRRKGWVCLTEFGGTERNPDLSLEGFELLDPGPNT